MGLISLGIGSPASIATFVLSGLAAQAVPVGPPQIISLGIGSPASVGLFTLVGLSPTATPVSRDIELLLALRRLRTVIQGINGRDGYTYAIKPGSVRLDPTNLLDTHESVRPLVALELTDGGERAFQPADYMEDERLVVISALIDVPGQRADRRITAGLRLAADLERAIASDLTLGGLAVSVRARQAEVLMAHQTSTAVIVQMPVVLQLYRRYGHPEGS